jgi:hypothetical protein
MADNIQFFVTQNELDGVEIDCKPDCRILVSDTHLPFRRGLCWYAVYECLAEACVPDTVSLTAISNDQTAAVAWIVTFTQSLRNALPVGQYLVSHAPIAPW